MPMFLEKNEEISLKDRLVTGLRATRPEEVQYCERVANAARSGETTGENC